MSDDTRFEPRIGRMHSIGDKPVSRFAARVLAAANVARGGPRRPISNGRVFNGARIGRAVGIGRVLASRGAHAAFSGRRVVVKANIVTLRGKGAAAATAHLRYLERDGTTREGTRAAMYTRDTDTADPKDFSQRGSGDRHQFRFIVSAEDGADYDDLKPLTRRLMGRVEQDLGTKLDWVAIDHFDTGHPHTHIVVRGKDHAGADLIIAPDYLTAGFRERACELVDLDLGPPSDRERAIRLRAEVEQERLTSFDRSFVEAMNADRIVAPLVGEEGDKTLQQARLTKLRRLGLAHPVGEGRWQLSDGFDVTLREMGERGDIIRTMQRDLARRGLPRALSDQRIHDPAAAKHPLIGRVVAAGIADEPDLRQYLIVDAVDGRSYYVDVGKVSDALSFTAGTVVRIDAQRMDAGEIDRTIAAVAAANHGRYDLDAHLRHDPSATEEIAAVHLQRLETLQREIGGIARARSGGWDIADEHLRRVEAYEAEVLRDRPVHVASLTSRPLAQLVEADAATWLDQELVARSPVPLRAAGFGAEVRDAQDQRRRWLIAQGLARDDGLATRYPPDLLAMLRRRELLRVSRALSQETGLAFVDALPGSRVEGVLSRSLELVSGRVALLETSREFSLVPWQPDFASKIGKSLSGAVGGDGISWTIGRGRGGPVIS